MKPQKFNENGEAGREIRVSPPAIFYRSGGLMDEKELWAAQRNFVTYKSRMMAHGGDLVIGRYSVLPFYKELEDDLATKGAKLINSYREHRYVADLQNYVADLGDMTFKTWNFRDITEIPDNIPLVVKGETNSKKDLWKTHMFAKDRMAAIDVYQRLQVDSLISQQDIYLREYVELALVDPRQDNAEFRLHIGNPATVEFRFFVAYGQVLSGGFYWSNCVDDLETVPSVSEVPMSWLQKAIDKVKDHVSFFVIDVAKTKSGHWIVVELNDGQMSGLSENDPEVLYKNLKHLTWDRYQ